MKHQSYPKPTKIDAFGQKICQCHSHRHELHFPKKGPVSELMVCWVRCSKLHCLHITPMNANSRFGRNLSVLFLQRMNLIEGILQALNL